MPTRSLSRRDAYDMFDFPRMFANPFWERWSSSGNPVAWIPSMECYVDKNRFNVNLALPGVKPEDVNLQVHGNELTISGERRQEVTPAEDRSFQREITYGSFERMVTLPEGIESDKIDAHFNNGVLEITAPLSEKALPRKIQIKAGDSGKKLAA